MSSWRSWFAGKKDNKTTGPDDDLHIDWTKVRQHPKVTAAFTSALEKDKATLAAMLCESHLSELASCEEKHPHGSQCEPLRLNSVFCMAGVVTPKSLQTFQSCLQSHPTNPEPCLPQLEAIIQELNTVAEDEPLPLTEKEKKVTEECDDATLRDEERLEQGLSCFIPKICDTQYADFARCLRSRNNDLDECTAEAQRVMECWGDFCLRWTRHSIRLSNEDK
jgi:hypothetical protein